MELALLCADLLHVRSLVPGPGAARWCAETGPDGRASATSRPKTPRSVATHTPSSPAYCAIRPSVQIVCCSSATLAPGMLLQFIRQTKRLVAQIKQEWL